VFYEINSMAQSDGSTDYEIAARNFFNKDLFPRRPSFVWTGLSGISDRKIWGGATPECTPPCKEGDTVVEMFSSNMCPVSGCKNIPCVGDCTMAPRASPLTALLQTYAEFGTGTIDPMRCIGQHGDKWEFGGSYNLRIGKQLNQAKGWHFGPYGHLKMGNIAAFWYLKLLKEVLQEILKAKPTDIKGTFRHSQLRVVLWVVSRCGMKLVDKIAREYEKPNGCKTAVGCTQTCRHV
jgi:hypothetical protein